MQLFHMIVGIVAQFFLTCSAFILFLMGNLFEGSVLFGFVGLYSVLVGVK